MGLDVGSDIALANAIGREIIAAGLEHREFIEHATTGLRRLPRGRRAVHAGLRRARDRRAGRHDPRRWRTSTPAPPGDDLLDARDHRAPQRGRQRAGADQPVPADRPRRSLRLGPQPAARAEQRPGRRRHGRLARPSARLPARRGRRSCGRSSTARGVCRFRPKRGWHLSQMFEAMERGDLRALYVIGENPLQSEADQNHARHLLEGLDFLVAQDMFLTKTAELAHVVLPPPRGVVRVRGHGDQQRAARAACAQGARAARPGARDDVAILFELAKRMGRDWGRPTPRRSGTSCAALSPMHAGMSYARLEKHGRAAVAVLRRGASGRAVPAQPALGAPGARAAGRLQSPSSTIRRSTSSTREFPLRLTTGRRLDEYNTGVQTARLPLAAPPRREPRRLAGGRGPLRRRRRRARPRASRAAARSRCRCAATSACARGSRS